MSNDLNQCQFIGRLGKDVETRYMPNGNAVASFTIAVGSQWKDKQSGAKQEATEWVNVSVFGKLAEICSEYLKKGSQVFVSGRMKTEKYQAKDGTDRYSTKIIAENMQMLGGKSAGGNDSQGDGQQEHQEKRSTPAAARRPAQDQSSAPRNFDNFDDDIPFMDPHGSRAFWRFAE